MTDDQITIGGTVWAKLALGGLAANVIGMLTNVFGWLTTLDLVALSGLLIGVLGFAVNWYYKAKQIRLDERYRQMQFEIEQERAEREKREHELRIGLME